MDIFRPDIYQRSIYDIDYEDLKRRGIKCVIFDLDNTLVPLDIDYPDKRLLDFFLYLDEINLKAIILSNAKKKRVEPFKEKCNVDSAYNSHKPFKKKYLKILKMYKLNITEVACVGDQLLTDILGANKIGLTSILVNRISDREKIVTRINRKIEKLIYHSFAKKGIFTRGEYYD